MKRRILLSLILLITGSTGLWADINDARITELWVGRAGGGSANDGTRDWVEITNTGDTDIDTSMLSYDDESAAFGKSLVLPAVLLAPGESIILLIDVDPADPMNYDENAGAIDEFIAIWTPFNGFITSGNADGGLSNNGDSATLFNVMTESVIDNFTYTEADVSDATMERTGDGATDIRPSVLGENGAYEAQPFFNGITGDQETDDKGNPIIMVGSPGIFIQNKEVLLGDVNCDGQVTLADIPAFVDLLSTGGFNEKADINGDDVVNLEDIPLFVDLLAG